MNKPSIDDMLAGKQSRYSLVIAVAKRAREISDEYNERGEVLDEKPVLLAVDDFKNHKYEIRESTEAAEEDEEGEKLDSDETDTEPESEENKDSDN